MHPWQNLKQWITHLWSTWVCLIFSKWDIWHDEEAGTSSHSPNQKLLLAEFPTEIILYIADELEDRESRVFLSLTCKRFRSILAAGVDLSFADRCARIQFLQSYERDLPDHLTCRSCGRLFEWRVDVGPLGYRCHSDGCNPKNIADRLSVYLLKEPRAFPLRRELVDLILKAQERGEQYGLPVSLLNGYCQSFSRTRRSYAARVIKGELILAIRSTRKLMRWEEANDQYGILLTVLCPHKYRIYDAHGNLKEDAYTLPYMNGPGESKLYKCRYCRTQYRSSVRESLPDNLVEIEVQVWISFGTRYDNSRCNEQLVRHDTSSHVVVDELEQRDLQLVFESFHIG